MVNLSYMVPYCLNKHIMIKKINICIFLFLVTTYCTYSQTTDTVCNHSHILCPGMSLPLTNNGSYAEIGPNYGCLYTQNNPMWFYLLIDQPGDITLQATTNDYFDTDFACWGPFNEPFAPCSGQLTATCNPCENYSNNSNAYPSGNLIDCDFSTSYTYDIHISNAFTGEYFILLITNWSENDDTINFSQTNIGQPGAGTLFCQNECNIVTSDMTASECHNGYNTFSVSGSLIFNNTPSIGSVVLTDTLSGKSSEYYFPLNSGQLFTIDSIPADGLTHNILVEVTGLNCSKYFSILSPPQCNCSSNAGVDTSFCGYYGNLNAIVDPGESNIFWHSPTSAVISDTSNSSTNIYVTAEGFYNLFWTTTSYVGIVCTDTVTVFFKEIPTPVMSGPSIACFGIPIEFNSINTNYLNTSWSFQDGQQLTPQGLNQCSVLYDSIGTFYPTIEVWDSAWCKNKDTLELNIIDCKGICLVSVDTLSGKNILYFNNQVTSIADHINVYKESSFNIYDVIGSLSTDTSYYFIDVSSYPMVHSDKYKISFVDNNGFETEPYFYHQTVNLVASNYGNIVGLSWNHYVDESGEFQPYLYYIFKGSAPDNLQLYDSLSGSYNMYNDIVGSGVFYYLIAVAREDGCGQSKNSRIYSLSNFVDNNWTTFDENEEQYDFLVFPNPANNYLYIYSNESSNIENVIIFNYLGQIVFKASNIDLPYQINVEEFPTGCYYIYINSNSSSQKNGLIILR